MPAPRGTSATRHNCIVSQSEAPVNTLFAEAAAFFARLSPSAYVLRARDAHDAPNAAGRTAAAHPPRIVGRIPQRPRGIRRGKPSQRVIIPPISLNFRSPRRMPPDGKSPPKGKDKCQNRLSPYRRPAPSDAAARNLRRPYALPHCLTAKTPTHTNRKTRGFRSHSPNRYTIFSTTTRTKINA